MTEDQAKTKWCPFSRTIAMVSRDPGIGATANRDGVEHYGVGTACNCIASACMAWRWYRTHIPNPDCPDGDLIPSTRTHGYCGLAGHWFEDDRR